MTARDTQARLRRQWLLYNLRFAIPAGLLVLPVLVFMVWFFAIRPAQETQDLIGAVVQKGIGIVTGVLWLSPRRQPADTIQTVFLNIGGRDAQADSAIGFQNGQAVNVNYRVGKSGRVYIETIAPLSRTRQPGIPHLRH